MSDIEVSETVSCRFCHGTGRVDASTCAEIVHGRPCRMRVKVDPSYYENHPERSHLKIYCGMHRNARVRSSRALDRGVDLSRTLQEC